MEKVLQNLIVALRGSGVRISVSESMDAMNAACLTGYSDRKLLKDSLSATLAKSQHEKEIFDTCFERFFSLDGFSDTKSDSCLKPAAGLGKEDSPLSTMLLSGDNAGLSMSMREAAQETGINGIWFFTQKSLYIQRILQAMGQEGLIQDIQRLNNEDSPFSRQKAGTLKAAKDLLFENVRDFVEQQFSMFAGTATEEIIERYLRHMKLSNLEQRDFHRMHIIIQKMVKRLNNLHSRRRKRSKRGLLDIKKTLRESVAYQGLLFDTRWKAKRLDRMDIMALCDVSRSVEAVSRFMLLFLYSLNEVVAKTSSFIFCSNLVEVSNVFEEYQVEEAVVRLKRGVGLGIQLGRTDYGQAFLDFKKKWLDAVSNKTTVLILGDARNNYGNPQTDILKLINERSKRIIWLNPEPRSFWGTGDSEMDRYLPYCYLAKECSTVTHLERAIDFLLGMGG
ncbi:MAG: VWA domain-containing protein [Deltaproteobacteria bacterium]|nr:VWA domain-containing protein [Deltaproteobacteria bacterium]MBW1910281.1 VWA domain-containing protein [Deltaproteobacteria bacterium]MBW2033562.1 VWA domain-containing protein [Deltaproteobacteria bacterium]MBW2114649.1 VWA domain-containing protein [Deltaproteobacteria bacterium]MBW2358616.1 VWA domain-containing protein [Deltaproteobacteria bacterium]